MMPTNRRILALAILGATLLGCGRPEDPLFPVEGQVVYGDKPLSPGTGVVILRADAAKGNTTAHEPRGPIDADGKFKVSTTLKPGAPAGWYKVAVIATDAKDPKSYAVPKTLIPTTYNDPDKAGLTFEVVPKAAPGTYDLKLKAK